MPLRTQIDCATVLNREARGESALYIEAFSPVFGLLRMIKKISRSKTSELPDFFNDLSMLTESDTPASLKFLREFSTLRRRGSISKSYEALANASAICACVIKNGINAEDAARLHLKLTSALDSIDSGSPPEIVRFKFMYLIDRDEGYPVREDFYENLSGPSKALMEIIVRTPSAQAAEFRSRTPDLLDKMCEWIYSNTDILPS